MTPTRKSESMLVTHHPARFDYATRSYDLKRIKYGEGARVLTAKMAKLIYVPEQRVDSAEWWCVISDEGFFEELMGPDDLVCIRRFDTELERFLWVESAYPGLRQD